MSGYDWLIVWTVAIIANLRFVATLVRPEAASLPLRILDNVVVPAIGGWATAFIYIYWFN